MKTWVNKHINAIVLWVVLGCFGMLVRLTLNGIGYDYRFKNLEKMQSKQEETNKAQQDFNTQKTEKDKDQDRVISAIVNKIGIKNDEIILQQKEASTY